MLYTEKGIAKIALGGALYGSGIPREQAFQMMDAYFEAGGNILDTARGYAAWLEGGADASEKTIAAYIRSRGLQNNAIVATKGGQPAVGSLEPRLGKSDLVSDLEQSLRCLQTDCIGIWYLHRDDPRKEVGEIMPVLDGFVKSGKIKSLGASNWTAERIAEANAFAEANGLAKFEYSEIMWSYADIEKNALEDKTIVAMDETEYESYAKNGLTVMAFASQAQGFFNKGEEIGGYYRGVYYSERNLEKLEKVRKIAVETGLSPTAVALCPLLHDTVPTVAIIGGRTVEQVRDSLTAVDLPSRYAEML